MPSRGEARPVRTDLGDECFRGAPRDTWDGLHEGKGFPLSGQTRCEFGVQPRNGSIQLVEVGELLTRSGKT
jgi:hypothetical protein